MTREQLLDAAVLVVARDGLDHATTKAIAAEVACNEVYIYRNFGNKEDLLQAAFNRADIGFVQNVMKHIDVMDEAGSRAHVKKIGDAMPAGAIQLEERIEKLVRDKKKAMQSRDYEHASVLRGSELELRSRLRAMLSAWTTEMSASAAVIDEQQISEVVASMTGIPLARMSQGEQQRLKDLYGYFSSVVVGQDEAVRKVTRAIQRSS